MCKALGSSFTFPSNSLMLFLLVSLFNESYCHPKIQLANYCEGSRFAWMLQKWWSICLLIFKMLQHFETFLSTFSPKCTNCIIFYVSRSSNIKIYHMWHFFAHFGFQYIYIYVVFGEKKLYMIGISKFYNPFINHMTTTLRGLISNIKKKDINVHHTKYIKRLFLPIPIKIKVFFYVEKNVNCRILTS